MTRRHRPRKVVRVPTKTLFQLVSGWMYDGVMICHVQRPSEYAHVISYGTSENGTRVGVQSTRAYYDLPLEHMVEWSPVVTRP